MVSVDGHTVTVGGKKHILADWPRRYVADDKSVMFQFYGHIECYPLASFPKECKSHWFSECIHSDNQIILRYRYKTYVVELDGNVVEVYQHPEYFGVWCVTTDYIVGIHSKLYSRELYVYVRSKEMRQWIENNKFNFKFDQIEHATGPDLTVDNFGTFFDMKVEGTKLTYLDADKKQREVVLPTSPKIPRKPLSWADVMKKKWLEEIETLQYKRAKYKSKRDKQTESLYMKYKQPYYQEKMEEVDKRIATLQEFVMFCK
jgi:hypothetical protein